MKSLAWPIVQVAVALNWWALTAPTEPNVRSYFGAMACGNSCVSSYLIQYGASAFPVYERFLTDPKCKPKEVGSSLCILSCVGGDRTRFVRLAAHHLTNDNAGVRFQAARLVEQIGSTNEGVILIALLSDRDISVACAAAQALAATGGSREFTAMEIWLKTADFQNRGGLLEHAQKHRDAFKKRLDSEAKKLRDGG